MTMTQTTKTAIQGAEQLLEKERKEKLQNEIYDYLKCELEAIDEIEQKISKWKTEKIAHEENIKNIKQGNLEAIEKRRISFPFVITTNGTFPPSSYINAGGANGVYFNQLAGMVVTTTAGTTRIF